MQSSWLGLDIGGANCKFASSDGDAWSVPFPLWKDPTGLVELLKAETSKFSSSHRLAGLAVTMTGELADCYRTKSEGVTHILNSVPTHADWEVKIFRTDGRWATLTEAHADPLKCAASTWLALGTLVARKMGCRDILLVDMGSTTTDIIPIRAGNVVVQGQDDPERLSHHELIYVGTERTPICSLIDHAWYRGGRCGIAREHFATTLDAYLWRGAIEERPKDTHTADGRPATREHAFDRLAKMVGADKDLFCPEDADLMAKAVYESHCQLIRVGLDKLHDGQAMEFDLVVWSGQADFLAKPILTPRHADLPVQRLSDLLGVAGARCAPAYSVACLASEDP